jgi:hypothetical protein
MDITRIKQRLLAPDGGSEGGDPGGAAGESQTGETWQSQSPYLTQNPDAAKAYEKYGTLDDALKGGHEAIKMVGQPYRLPKDYSKLTDEQRSEIRSSVATLDGGVPETAEGYEFTLPDTPIEISDDGVKAFKEFCHAEGIPVEKAQKLLNFQIQLTEGMNATREKLIGRMTADNWQSFLKSDCAGNKDLAGQRLVQVQNYLQSQFKKDDGTVDTEGWEAFRDRIMYQDKMIELPLLRALIPAAQQHATGGAPGGTTRTGSVNPHAGGLEYKAMKGRKYDNQ